MQNCSLSWKCNVSNTQILQESNSISFAVEASINKILLLQLTWPKLADFDTKIQQQKLTLILKVQIPNILPPVSRVSIFKIKTVWKKIKFNSGANRFNMIARWTAFSLSLNYISNCAQARETISLLHSSRGEERYSNASLLSIERCQT